MKQVAETDLGWIKQLATPNKLMLLVFGLFVTLVLPAKVYSRPSAESKRSGKARNQRCKRQHRRCRDAFCTVKVMRLDKNSTSQEDLSGRQVEQTMHFHFKKLEHCLLQARRRDPYANKAHIEFVVNRRGWVLASRVNGQQKSMLALCIKKRMRTIRFPGPIARRTIAGYTLRLASGG